MWILTKPSNPGSERMANDFSSQLEADLLNIFFNFDEFADYHQIDSNAQVLAIIDTDVSQSLTPPNNRREGTYTDKIILMVMQDAFQRPLKYDQILMLDKREYRIINRNIYKGMYVLTLEAIR